MGVDGRRAPKLRKKLTEDQHAWLLKALGLPAQEEEGPAEPEALQCVALMAQVCRSPRAKEKDYGAKAAEVVGEQT